MRTQLPSALLATALASAFFAAPAQAQAPRTFVSGAGSDGNNCTNVATPCRHFAAAFAATAPGGEIFVLDPANYGSVTITHAVSIEGHGWASVAPPNGGNAITINAGSGDNISIQGVSIDGTGATGATNGIVFNSGGRLTVNNCVVQNFAWDGSNTLTGNGIMIVPTSGAVNFVITNTFVTSNGNVGVYYLPLTSASSANGVIDHVVATANQYGMSINTFNATGGSAVTAVSNSVASNNTVHGIYIENGPGTLTVSIENTNISGNTKYGIEAVNTPNVILGRSTITANLYGIANFAVSDTFNSFQDNHISGNISDVYGSLNLYASK